MEFQEITRFAYQAPQSALDDLKQRLAKTRWPECETTNDWTEGVPLEKLRALIDYWRFRNEGSGYLVMQSTRPQTIGYALMDSPVGQAAWIYDIFNTGTGYRGNPEEALTRDQMLDEISLYWLTGTAASSARFYFEQRVLLGRSNNAGRVDLPVGVSRFPNDLPAPRSWAQEIYPNLFYWNELDSGGHFASLEKPELFTQELRNCFSKVRQSDHPGSISEKA